jgi:hypothetical protein
MPGPVGYTSEGIAALMPYFNTILGAVEQHYTTADLWQAYRNAEQLAGVEPGTPTIQDMNYMRGAAGAVVSAEANLANGAGPDVLAADQWAWAPWAAGDTDSWLSDRYQVRYQGTLTGPEGQTQDWWGTTDLEGSLEGVTKDQILARSLTSGQLALDQYDPSKLSSLGIPEGFNLTGINRVQILRV